MNDTMTRRALVLSFVVALCLCGTATLAQTAPIRDAELRHLGIEGNLGRQIARIAGSATQAAWITWTAPAVESGFSACCFDWREGRAKGNGACRLESGNRSWNHSSDGAPGSDLRVLVRVEDGDVDAVRVYSSDCVVDAEGRVVYEADGVGTADSVSWLESLLPTDRRPTNRVGDSALTAIALHGGDEADRALVRLTDPEAHGKLREQAAFWLGVARGRRGYERLTWMLANDPSRHVAEQVVFALSQSPVDEALDLLIATARDDGRSEMRAKALFWLSQKAGERATATLDAAVKNDPDAEVREQAVFALSQLPHGEGVPKLLELARSSKYPEVREKALFWLGQSKDPRALALFEEILQD